MVHSVRCLVSFCLTIRYKLFLLYLSAKKESVGSSELVNAIANNKEANNHDPLSFIVLTLRKYPYWVEGHKEFARYALERKLTESAYASSLALLELEGKDSPEALHLLARCFLQSAQYQKAIDILVNLFSADSLSDVSVAEDYAASLMALEQYQEAIKVLSSVPAKSLSPAGEMALTASKSALSKATV